MKVEELWQSYAAAVGVPVGGVQWTETRRAFYAGAMGLLCELKGMGGSEDEGVAALKSLESECVAFAESVGRGSR